MASEKEQALRSAKLSSTETAADAGTNAGLETATQTQNDLTDRYQAYPPVRIPARERLGHSFRYLLTVEAALYGLLLGLAIFTRFYDLSYRALHHDEGVHAYYSWKFFNGGGYEQEPWKHGPFLYHIQALVFWIFGDSDQTARLSTALFGVLTCLLPMGLRKELGRWGALTASFLLLVSPMFLYYSRFLREDIFVAFATFSLAICLIRFVDRPRVLWWNLAMVSLALLICTKEVSFFYIALFGGFMLAWLGWQLAPRLLLILGGYALVALLVFFFVMSLYPPPTIPFETVTGSALSDYVGSLLMHPVFWAFIILAILGGVVAWLAFKEVAVNRRRFVLSQGWAAPGLRSSTALFMPYQEEGTVAYAVGWLGRHRRTTLLGLTLALAFYLTFYTGFFSDIPQGSVGLFSGLWYWMAQQGVARGSQPWYYYFFMMPLYEPLALLLGTLASGFILYKAVRFGFHRPHRTVLMPVDELPTSSPNEPGQDEDENELDEPGETRPTGLLEPSLQNQNSTLIEVEVSVRPAGNALWPGRRRRERHPYFVPLLLVTWAWGSFALYTWASEKMPWLTVQLALPFILLAAYLMDGVWRGIEEYFLSGEHRQIIFWNLPGRVFFWILVGGLTATGFLAYMTMLNLTSAELKVTVANSLNFRFDWLLIWIPPAVALLFFTAVFSFIGLRIALKATAGVVFGLLTIYLLHTGFTFAFDHGDVAFEMGIYVQTAPDTYRVVKELNTVSTVMAEHKALPILYDDDMRTPLDFYLRDYTARKKLSELQDPATNGGTTLDFNTYSVIMLTDPKVAALDTAQKKALSDNFVARHYTFHWWFEESQYRDFDRAAATQTQFLTGKVAASAVRDASNAVVMNKGDPLTAERLQQLAAMPGVLDKLYNTNGGNSTLLHLKEAGQALYELRTPGDFSRLWRYVMYRDQTQPLGRREFTLYIKKDIIGLWRQYGDLVDFPVSRPQ